jgi:2-polyprenyl-3-methyl-5-hydroxy-6-metoxy-1,4-benzoquinol methylase
MGRDKKIVEIVDRIMEKIRNEKKMNVKCKDATPRILPLARLVAEKDRNIKMNIYESHPSEFGLKRAAEFENINIIGKLDSKYDCLMSTDFLEHVSDLLNNFAKMIKSVKLNGYLVLANAFYPMIRCRLPQNFHFRYSFNLFARLMGLKAIEVLEGSHTTIFKKIEEIEPKLKKSLLECL